MANQASPPSGSLPQKNAVSAAWKHVSLKPTLPTRGFENNNGLNLCYRNAALMLFLHTPQFLSWCEKYLGQSTSKSVPDVVRKLYDMFIAYWQCPNRHEQALESLWIELQSPKYGQLCWQITLGQQHDTFEMLENMISLLQRHTSQPYNDELMDLMTVALSGCRVCKTCKQKDSTAGDRVRYLSANLPSSMNATPTEEAIISGMKSETLAGCKTCATKQTPHEIQTQIVFPSEILIVQVNRYKKSGKLRDEIEVQGELAIPDSLLDDSVKGQGKIAYELYAILFHIGVDSKSGHYTAAVKGPSGEWVMTNDSRVIFTQTLEKSMSSPGAGKENVYILAYRRLETQSNSADSNTGLSAAVTSSNPKASITGQSVTSSGHSNAGSSNEPGSRKGSVKGGVQMKGIIELEGRPIQWTINQQLLLDPGKGALVALGPRARTQRATLQLTLTSEDTGEILGGQVTTSLKPWGVQKPKRGPSKTADTKDSSAGTKKAADTVSGKAAKPKGVTKKPSSPPKGTRQSARLRSKAKQ
ncbi:Ubiquitin carboxyl-terminal hydrolase [Aspergillus fumigatus Z5]|nr:Ubiquitin carboxyl-terminal hydrolase [Aspergillus fumigatus Z5]